MVKTSRRKSRKRAITLLYQSDLMQKDIKDVLDNEQSLGTMVDDFAQKLALGVYLRKEELDSIIEGVVKNWTLDRIAIIDLNILRVAIFEMYYIDDIPLKVSVDEAIEIAKILGQKDDTPKFINGILGKILANLTLKNN
ncbi:MAG: transcription antitermination factor NusB [Actinomycetota bacterium]|jgi:N utilization substance protein B|nr:transcription antitermination factor NusB [Actinomycetota bacterium]